MKTVVSTLFALALLGTTASAQQQPPPALVEVETARSDEVAATTWVPGTVVSRFDARIAAEISGRATWVAEIGAKVSEGDPIAKIEDRELRLQLADNEAAVARLKAQLAYEDSQLKRLEKLARSDNAAANQLDEARSQREVMRQNLRAAEIERERLEFRLSRTEVAAPFGGRIVERLIQPGEFVNSGTAVARLVDTEHKEVRARAPLTTARFVRDGMLVAVRDEVMEAKNEIRTVVPVGDEQSRMIEIRIALEQSDWIIGGPVRVALPVSEARPLVAIPRDALVLRGDETFVFRVADDNTAEQVRIETGIGLGSLVEVLEGINPGDQLVVRGGETLRPGQPISVASGNANGP